MRRFHVRSSIIPSESCLRVPPSNNLPASRDLRVVYPSCTTEHGASRQQAEHDVVHLRGGPGQRMPELLAHEKFLEIGPCHNGFFTVIPIVR